MKSRRDPATRCTSANEDWNEALIEVLTDAFELTEHEVLRNRVLVAEQGEIAIAIRRLRWPGIWLLLSPLWLVWAFVSFNAGVSSGTFLGLVLTVLCALAITRYWAPLSLPKSAPVFSTLAAPEP